MGIFASLFGKKKHVPAASLRDTLFGDVPVDQFPDPDSDSEDFPWSVFISARNYSAAGAERAAVACWHTIVKRADLEPRLHLQAWHFLRMHGEQPPPDIAKQVLGVVVEIGMPMGTDLLAAYSDHAARYYNFSGAAVIWEHDDPSMNAIIEEFLALAVQTSAHLQPAKVKAETPPTSSDARISLLTPGGIRFVEGSMSVIGRDPHTGPVLHTAGGLMRALIAKSEVSRRRTFEKDRDEEALS